MGRAKRMEVKLAPNLLFKLVEKKISSGTPQFKILVSLSSLGAGIRGREKKTRTGIDLGGESLEQLT